MNSTLVRSRLRILAIALLGAFSLSLVPLLIVENFFAPATTFGVAVDRLTLLVAVDDPRAAKAGVRDGDELDVARTSYDDRLKLLSGISWPAGTAVTVSLNSPRFGSRRLVLRAFPDPLPLDPGARFELGTHVLIAILWVVIGGVLVAMRPSLMTWGFYFFCLGLHPYPSFGA